MLFEREDQRGGLSPRPGPDAAGASTAVVDARMHTDLTAIDQLEALGVTVELPRTSQAVRRHRKLDPTRTAALHLTY